MQTLKMPALQKKVNLSRATIYRYIQQGQFPAQVKLGQRAVGWVEEEVEQWLQSRAAARANQ
jgi:prophage regulatory protein